MPEQAQRPSRVKAIVGIVAAIAASSEGLRQVAYYDPPGILTVCYGSTSNVQKNKVYSLQECRERLSFEMAVTVSKVEKCVPEGTPDRVLIAFSDAAYNLGLKIACDPSASTAARLLDQRRYDEACEQLPRWDKARVGGVMVALPGLTIRRKLERDICLHGVEVLPKSIKVEEWR